MILTTTRGGVRAGRQETAVLVYFQK